ncbi:LysR family transcriptional regulator [Streptomyces fumigatiscleroticus]|nr:LysR family transcriptional regulator [Streptomyces fumigatiscleroticus]
MDIRAFTYFIAVADELHFGRAAKKLHISQPGLSQAIKGMEREIGAPLFHRSRQLVALTAIGEELLPEARRLVAHAEEVNDFAHDMVHRHHATLLLAHTASAGLGPAHELTAAFRSLRPHITVRSSAGFSSFNLERVRTRRVDVAFVRPPVDLGQDLGLLGVAREEVLVALPPGHPMAGRHTVRFADVAAEPLVYFSRESGGLWESIIEAVYPAGLSPQIVREEPDEAHMLMAVAQGHGMTLVTREAVALLDVPGVTLRPLEGAPTVPLALVWRKDNTKSALADFLSFVADATDQRSPSARREQRAPAAPARRRHTTQAVRAGVAVAPVPSGPDARISRVQHLALPPALSSSERSIPIGL